MLTQIGLRLLHKFILTSNLIPILLIAFFFALDLFLKLIFFFEFYPLTLDYQELSFVIFFNVVIPVS